MNNRVWQFLELCVETKNTCTNKIANQLFNKLNDNTIIDHFHKYFRHKVFYCLCSLCGFNKIETHLRETLKTNLTLLI